MARDSSNTSGTEETPFLESATHKYCLMAFTNISCVRKTGPAPCSTDSKSCRETTLERNSWDLKVKNDSNMKLNTFPNNGKLIQNLSIGSDHCGSRALRSPPATSQFLWSRYWHDSSFTCLSNKVSWKIFAWLLCHLIFHLLLIHFLSRFLLWVGWSITQGLHGKLAEGAEHEKGIFL